MTDHWGTQPQPSQPDPGSQPEVLSDQPYAAQPAGQPVYGAATGTFLPAEPARAGAGKAKFVVAGVGALAIAAVGVGAAFAAGAFGGGGTQPDKLVPASAVAYFSVDLDPSLGQKVDALRFLRKFPDAKKSLGSTDDLRQWVFDSVSKDDPDLSSLSYARDVKPWIGDRFGVAVVPAGTSGAEPDALVIVQVKDAAKAKAGLKKLMSDPGDGTCSISDGYAVCAQTQAILSAAQSAAKAHPLSKDAHFSADVSSAGDRGIVLAWGDAGKLSKLVPSMGGGLAAPLGLSSAASRAANGRFVASVRFSGSNLEVKGTYTGATKTASAPAGTGVEKLPASTQAAFAGSVDPAAVTKAWRQFQTGLAGAGAGDQVQQGLSQFGLHLPGDLNALLGSRFAVAFGGMHAGVPLVGIRSDANAAKAGAVLDKVGTALRQNGVPYQLHHTPAADGYAVALDPAYAKELAANGSLGSSAAFKAAVPDASSANVVLFVNVARLLSDSNLASFGQSAGSIDANVKAVSAVGLSARSDSHGGSTFRLDVITR